MTAIFIRVWARGLSQTVTVTVGIVTVVEMELTRDCDQLIP